MFFEDRLYSINIESSKGNFQVRKAREENQLDRLTSRAYRKFGSIQAAKHPSNDESDNDVGTDNCSHDLQFCAPTEGRNT